MKIDTNAKLVQVFLPQQSLSVLIRPWPHVHLQTAIARSCCNSTATGVHPLPVSLSIASLVSLLLTWHLVLTVQVSAWHIQGSGTLCL